LQIVTVVDEDFFSLLDVVGGEDAGHKPEPGMLERDELGVRHERVVRLVSERGPNRNMNALEK
jgi:hypothetical protein